MLTKISDGCGALVGLLTASGDVSFVAFNKKSRGGIIVSSNSTNDVDALGTRLNFAAKNVSFSGN